MYIWPYRPRPVLLVLSLASPECRLLAEGVWLELVGSEWSGVDGWPPASLPACSLAHFSGSRESDSYYGQSAIYCKHSDEH